MIIREGEKFSVSDLKETVAKAVGADVGRCFNPGSNLCDILLSMTPEQYAEGEIAVWQNVSSAHDLDKNLRDKGYKTTYRFSYDYSIPGLTSKEVVRDAYMLEYFYKIATSKPRIRRGMTGCVNKIFDNASRVSYYYAQYIWANNPDSRFDYAKRFDVPRDWGFVLSFLLGVGYQFHPKDVYEFVTHHNDMRLSRAELDSVYKKQEVFKNWCARRGVDTGCLVLCPEHQDKLRKILTKTDTPYWIQKLQQLLQNKKVR